MNVNIINSLKACADFTPRTFAVGHQSAGAHPATELLLTAVTAREVNKMIEVETPTAHWLRTGDVVSTTGGDAPLADGAYAVTVTSATKFEVGPFPSITADDNLAGCTIVAHLYFRAAALFGKTPAGAANASALTMGYSSTLLPIDLASGGEYSLISQPGSKHDLASFYIKPAAANAGNGIVAILY